MKIPVCQADFDSKKIDKIARLVSKTAAADKIGLAMAKAILSVSLGYSDYHDLRESTCAGNLKFAGSPRQLNRAIAENVESRFSPGESNWIMCALESWGIHRLGIYSIKSPSLISNQLLDEISMRLNVHLGSQLPKRLSASLIRPGDSDTSERETVSKFLSKSLPPLIVMKDIAHEEINEIAPAECSCLHFELDSYRMLVKRGAIESEITQFMGLTPTQLEFLKAVSMEFDAQLNVEIPAFLRRYGFNPNQLPAPTFHSLAGINLFD